MYFNDACLLFLKEKRFFSAPITHINEKKRFSFLIELLGHLFFVYIDKTERRSIL